VVGGQLDELRDHELLLELACHLPIQIEFHETAATDDEHDREEEWTIH
jgi:hypothetical protein